MYILFFYTISVCVVWKEQALNKASIGYFSILILISKTWAWKVIFNNRSFVLFFIVLCRQVLLHCSSPPSRDTMTSWSSSLNLVHPLNSRQRYAARQSDVTVFRGLGVMGNAAMLSCQSMIHHAEIRRQKWCTPYKAQARSWGTLRSLDTLYAVYRNFLFLCCRFSYVFLWQDGGTALTVASQYGHSKVVDTLLKNGANVHDQLNVSHFCIFSVSLLTVSPPSWPCVKPSCLMVNCTRCPSSWNLDSQVSADCWVRHDWHLAGLLSLGQGKTTWQHKHPFIKQ